MRSLVSIIVPCYNSETWIAEAIRSALDQTWETKEIVVIDDGSTDGSLSVIKSFGNSIRWETGPNRGGCAARNRGIELAQGDYIQFLDSDDALMPDCIEGKMVMDRGADERACSGVELWAEESSRDMVDYWNWPVYDLEFIIKKGAPSTLAPLHLRKDLAAIGGFREDLRCAQEYDLHLRMAAYLGIRFVSNGMIGAKIRRRGQSVSQLAGTYMYSVTASILLHLWQWMENQPDGDRDKMASAISQRLTCIARTLHWRGEHKEAAALAATARALHPSWHKSAYRTNVGGVLANIIGFEGFERLHQVLRRGKR